MPQVHVCVGGMWDGYSHTMLTHNTTHEYSYTHTFKGYPTANGMCVHCT